MPGFLTDRQIRERLAAGELIDNGTWIPDGVRHASYTLRLGSRVEVERASQSREQDRQRNAIRLREGGEPLELQPGDTALLFSMEQLRMPSNMLGFTVARGLMFVETLTPENTYVDPGFSGNLYTTVTNLSGRVLRLPYGSAIARIFFYELAEAVADPYRTGAAIGVEQHLESRPALDSSYASSRTTTANLVAAVVRTERSGPELAEINRRQGRLAFAALVLAVTWPVIIAIANGNQSVQDFLGGAIVANALGTLLAGALGLGATRAWRYLGGA